MTDNGYVGRYFDRGDLDEINLLSELIVAASESDGPLTDEQVDAILGSQS
ncbi:hypothetical protein [Solicola gregarius]|uniref:Uncharacterized protein n=1 Tax=Solicola gregarius TaxID=2908642 RepID=A0AA46YL46_9ACTN|nr:hypothetical protein [Solicola gregarius]UYM06525.1 hypothetical protein L0C25_05480 [Solicola gregarius]